MTLEEQRSHVRNFFAQAHRSFITNGLTLVVLKGTDYSPERIPMTEAFFAAAELGVDVPHILWVHCRKHMSAIARWMSHGELRSEDIRSRLLDVANYMALTDSYLEDPMEWLLQLRTLIQIEEFKSRGPEEVALLLDWVNTQIAHRIGEQ